MSADRDSEKLRRTSLDLYGSSRNRRTPHALHPEFFKIDERTLADFLVFTEKYAAYIRADGYEENEGVVTTAKNISKENWKAFFASDISVLLAKVCYGKPEKRITYSLKQGASHPHRSVMLKVDAFLALVATIADCIPYAAKVKVKDRKMLHLLTQLDELNVWMQNIVSMVDMVGIELKYPQEQSSILQITGHPSPQSPQEAISKLDASLDAFLGMAHKVTHAAKELFQESIQQVEYHNPAIALFIAFLKLYQYVQEDLNRITGKHLDYFFKEQLQQKIKPPEPDEVHVCFRLSDHVETYTIERGTLFKAGVDEEGLDCLYEAQDYLTLNKAQVTELGSFYISKKDEIGLEPHYEFISGIYESTLLSSASGGFDFTTDPKPFPTFGEEQYDIKQKTMEPSEIGFAIASPVLLLREGVRKVNLAIQFNLKSMSSLVSFFERYSRKENLSADKVFHKVFSDAFRISLTTSKGWYEIPDYKVLPPDWGNGKIEISFILPMGAPGITPMNEEWPLEEVDRYRTQWPVLKACISDQKTMYTYSYLQHLVINECSVTVEVSGIKNLEVYNDLGKVETSTPFYPFGPLPVVGSSFVIGNDELYKKQIKEFSLELIWHNLPRNEGGFEEYYEDYNAQLNNDSFKVGITALSDFEFHPKAVDKIQVFSLFTTSKKNDQSSSQKLVPKTILDGIDVKALKINSELEKSPLPPFDNTAKAGYIRLELVAPEMSFGHQEYPALMSAKVIKKAKNEDIKLPNPPYIPQLKSLVLNYEGVTKISFQKLSATKADPQAEEKIYQLQPFGIRTIFEKCSPVVDTLFPQYDHHGYLLLGLQYITTNEPVTFCFVLEQNTVIEVEADMPQIEWFFVSDDNWIPFDKKSIIFDTTKNFTTSGILKLVMPSTISNTNTILPTGRYWIIAALKGDTRTTGKIRGLYTQSITLSWKSHKKNAVWQRNISAYTIESLVNSRSEIATIFQPMPSYGGRPMEKLHDLYTRVSERLRHKNRGVTAWDIERLVLEKFPAVNQVKCITSIDSEVFVEPGKIILVAVPAIPGTDEEFTLPRFNQSELKDIQYYVSNHISPFVTITVINPVYEVVKITANVNLVDQLSKGGSEEELHRDVLEFICPWFNNPDQDMMLGGWIDLDEVTDFLNTRPYIKSVSKVSIVILHYNNKVYTISDSVVSTDINKTLFASRPWSVLVPMKNHQISIHEKDQYLTPEKAAIENMRLGNEFVLTSQKKEEHHEITTSDDISFGDYIVFDIDLQDQ
jgi:hypothetical protein